MSQHDKLRSLLVERALSIGSEKTLSTGKVSKFYFDCKRVTLSSDGAAIVGDAFLDKLRNFTQQVSAVGGRTLGADPIVGAMMMRALNRGLRLEGFYVRQRAKAHGTMRLVENAPTPGTRVVVVDDVVTTGRSVIEAIDAARGLRCEVVGVIALVDRLDGGSERVRAKVQHYITLYTRDDFPQTSEAKDCHTTSSAQPSSPGASILTTSGV